MSSGRLSALAWLAVVLALPLAGCEEPPASDSHKPSASSQAAPSAPAPTTSATASAEPPAPKPPRDDCPEGSAGPGTFDEPCKAEGDTRLMEVTWTKKTDDKGPQFRVVNKSKLTILYGSVSVYFYDKSGKQLEVPGEKPHPKQTCSGKIFDGVMKPGEKAVMWFSCVKKSHVPEGTETIEAELGKVGFADESGKRTEFYWTNDNLVPDERPKGGVKAKPGKPGKKSKQ